MCQEIDVQNVNMGRISFLGAYQMMRPVQYNLGSSPLLTRRYAKVSRDGHASDRHILSIVKLMKTLKWNHVIVFSDHSYRDEYLQFFLPADGLVSTYDLEELCNRTVVKQLLQQLHKQFFPRLYFLLLSNYSRAMDLLQITGSSNLHQLMTTSGRRTFSASRDITDIKEEGIFPNTRYGLNKRKLIVSVKEYESFVMKKGNGFEGYLIDVLQALASTLNFSYEFVQPVDMRWGDILNGRWDGLVGQLERREVDLAVATLTIHEDRESVMDFLYPPVSYWKDDIMYNFEADGTEGWQIYLKHFNSLVLLVLFVSILFSIVGGYILHRCDDALSGKERNTDTWEHRLFTMADIFFYMFGILINRGLKSNPRNQSTRLLWFSWGMFSLVIAACYSANLMAFLAVQKPKLPIRNLGELVRQKEYKWGFLGGAVREHIFNRSTSADMKLVWKGVLEFNKTDPEVLSKNESLHLAKVKAEKYAFIMDRYTIMRSRSRDCNIRCAGQGIIWHQYGIGVPTDYPLRRELEEIQGFNIKGLARSFRTFYGRYAETFTKYDTWLVNIYDARCYPILLAQIVDSGLHDFWWEQWSKMYADKCSQAGTRNTLCLADVASPFYLLCVGLGTAGIALVLEIIAHKRPCRW